MDVSMGGIVTNSVAVSDGTTVDVSDRVGIKVGGGGDGWIVFKGTGVVYRVGSIEVLLVIGEQPNSKNPIIRRMRCFNMMLYSSCSILPGLGCPEQPGEGYQRQCL
jgi:hypothetical protein